MAREGRSGRGPGLATTAGRVALLLLAFGGAMSLFAARGSAASNAAEITLLEGDASIVDGEAKTPLRKGSLVSEGQTVLTGEAARLELQFADKSVIRLGPAAKLTLTAAQFGRGPQKRRMTARLWFGRLWAKVTSVVQGEQKFQIETENAVAGVRGTTFRVEARGDKSVLVRVYSGTVAVGASQHLSAVTQGGQSGTQEAAGGQGAPGGRQEVAGPEEVSREKWEKLVGRQMEILVSAEGVPGEPAPFTKSSEQDDSWIQWNETRDSQRR